MKGAVTTVADNQMEKGCTEDEAILHQDRGRDDGHRSRYLGKNASWASSKRTLLTPLGGLDGSLTAARGFAVRKAFRNRALVQRCQWHKRENVVRYLAKREQARGASASNAPYDPRARDAPSRAEDRNQSAAGSLAEGLDETLTLHRLGLYGVLGRSLKTTNCLESINALVEERCAKVDHWQNSSQRPLAGDRAPGHRTALAEGDGLPAPAHAPCRVSEN